LMLPNQLDNQFNFVNSTSGVLGIGAAFLLAPRFQAVGIAWSAVASQVYTLLAFAIVLGRAGLNPFSNRERRFSRPPSLGDLAAVSGLDHQEIPVELVLSQPKAVEQEDDRGKASRRNG
jgi:hypothetical protein